MTTYYHGGPAGIPRFGLVQPPSITGAPTTADHGAGSVCRRDRVYVTTRLEVAMLFASGHLEPRIYEVVPVGELEPDPDCDEPGMSFACLRARVRRIIKLSPRDVEVCRQALGIGGV